jgi:uncharacterized protein YndB with AHSA1/START domain
MTEARTGAWTRTSRIIKARPEELYAAFMDPGALVAWLPPGEMTGEIHEFDARVGGGYRMSLFYPATERSSRGKTSDKEDMVTVRFVELAPARRIVEGVKFVTTDPALFGEMTIEITFEPVSGGTEVTAGRGQRGRLALVAGTAGAPLRMTKGRSAAPSRC